MSKFVVGHLYAKQMEKPAIQVVETVAAVVWMVVVPIALLKLCKDDPRVLAIMKKSKELQVGAHIASTHDGFVHDRP